MKDKAVIYARVSTKGQEEEGYSIPAQIKLLKDYALKKGMEIVQVFQESESASKAGRRQFDAMLKFLNEQNEVKDVLVEKTDRLYRNLKDYSHIDSLLEEKNYKIHLVKENEILDKNARSQTKFIHGIKALVSKNYSDNLSEEVKKGKLEKAEQGHYPSVAPYGYKNNILTRLIEPDEEKSLFVKRAFELYSSQEFSLDTLREQLYEEGFRYLSSMPRIPRSNLERMLHNVLYIGDFYWNEKYYKGKHKPIISSELFEKVQEITSNRSKGQKSKRDFQFTGLLSCPSCGRAITAELKKGKYVYYHCSNAKCPEKSVCTREEEIEKQFLELLNSIKIDANLLEIAIKALKEHLNDEKDFHDESVKNIQSNLVKTRNKLEKIYEDKLDGLISEEFWFKKHNDYVLEQNSLLKSLEQHEQGSNNYLETGIQLIELSQRASELYSKQNSTERRRLLRFLSSNYMLKAQKLDCKLKEPFEHIVKLNQIENIRRGWDSNPRYPQGARRFSRPFHSTALAPLQNS
jgi:site-specific DNA recombinase